MGPGQLLLVDTRLLGHPRAPSPLQPRSPLGQSVTLHLSVSAGLPTLPRRALLSPAQRGILGLHVLESAAPMRPLPPIRVRPSDSWYLGTGYAPYTRGLEAPAETQDACPDPGASLSSAPPFAALLVAETNGEDRDFDSLGYLWNYVDSGFSFSGRPRFLPYSRGHL